MARNKYGREANRYGFDGGLEMESMYGLPSLLDDRTNTHMSSVPQNTAIAPSQKSVITNTVQEIAPNPSNGKLGTEPGGKSNAIDVSQKALTRGNIPLEKSMPPLADDWLNKIATNQRETAMQQSANLQSDPAALQKRRAAISRSHSRMLETPALTDPGRPNTSNIPYDPNQGEYNRFSNDGKGGWGSYGATEHFADPVGDATTFADVDIEPMEIAGEAMLGEGKPGIFQKGKDLLGKGGDLLNKYAGPASMVIQGVNSIREYGQRNKVIDSLEDSVSELTGAIANMPNEKDAGLEAMGEQFSEERRKIGQRRNLVLGAKLDAARERKTGGLVSGSKQELMDDITDTLQTTTDLDLARAEESHDAQESKFIEDQRNKRADATRQLEQLTEQLEQQKKEQKWAPVEGIVDLAITGVSIANPAAGMALGMAKSGAKSMIT